MKSVYRYKGATWEVHKIRNGKWALYRKLRFGLSHFGNFRSRKAALVEIYNMIPEGE